MNRSHVTVSFLLRNMSKCLALFFYCQQDCWQALGEAVHLLSTKQHVASGNTDSKKIIAEEIIKNNDVSKII